MRRLLTAASLMLIFAGVGLADAKLDDYKGRVLEAAEQVITIREDGENASAYIRQVKELIPRSEKVELDGRSIAVDNTWLHVALDAYVAERDNEKRASILGEAADRLYSLADRINSEDAAENLSEDTARSKVKEILSRTQFAEKKDGPITAFIKDVKRRVFEFFRDLITRVFNALLGAGSEASWLFRGLIILALGAALYAFARMLIGFKRGDKRKKKRTVLGEEIDADVTASDLANAAMLAARSGDFRTGVRKLYLSLLYELAERNLIELEPDRTNHEYLAKVARFSTLAAPMRYLTERFDYIWYGMFPSSEEDFAMCVARYKEAIEQAGLLDPKPEGAGQKLAVSRS